MLTIHRAEDPFDRQRLIAGWHQESVQRARVLLAGVGALGSACATDLVLTGVRHLAIVDFDTVATSNMSRTIVFRRGDEGRRKVDAAHQYLTSLSPADGVTVVPLHTDVVWELGWGVYRRSDVVLGCVDSIEARTAVGATARAFGVPAIIGGIFGWDGNVVVQGAREGACVGCTFSPADWNDRSRRYSCDDVRRVTADQALVPATQVISSLIGALMVNEALQIAHGDRARGDRRLFVSGRHAELCRIGLQRRANCRHHLQIRSVREEPLLSSGMRAGALLEHVRSIYGARAVVPLGRDFLLSSSCKGCRERIRLARPRHRTTERDLVCDTCWTSGRESTASPKIEIVNELSTAIPSSVLDLPLSSLGIPPLHVLPVVVGNGFAWIELTGDLERVLPGWPAMRETDGRQ